MIQLAKPSAWPMTLASAATLLLTACGGGGSDTSSGTLRLALTDAPACGYDHVYVTVDSVKVHQSASASENDPGWYPITRPSLPQRIDLLELRNGLLQELGQTALPAGRYTQMRLMLSPNSASTPYANAVTPTGGAPAALTTPSAQQSGLKLNVDIAIEAGRMADFVLDFDACKSVVTAGNSGKFNLKPVISVLPRFIDGMAVDGYVANSSPYTSVSLQLDGVVVRSTVPDPIRQGYFALPYLPGSGSNYDLVIADPGRGTRVVSAVPVTPTAITHINAASQPIALSSSSAQSLVASATAGNASADATISVHQVIGIGREIELASRAVDSVDGSASFTLATDPVQIATYVPALAPLSWLPHNASAAQFSVRSSVPGHPLQSRAVDLSGASARVDFSY
ncbi:MAG: hypothetical protein RLZZ22_197 [Pseudomonadota bacterium]|jgi:hypothetical protein